MQESIETAPARGETTTATPRRRVLGLDVARAFAILGIFIAHYGSGVTMLQEGWTVQLVESTSGRALPVFVILAGVGFTFLTKRAEHPIREIAGRSLVLLVVGLLFDSTTTIGMILQYYALYFMVALLFRRMSDRALLISAAATVAIGAVIYLHYLEFFATHFVSPSLTTPTAFGTIRALAYPHGLLSMLLVSGWYPLFPTFAFFLVGMWLGRQDLSNPRLRQGVFAVGLAMFVGATALNSAIVNDGPGSTNSKWQAIFKSEGHSNMPGWMVAATGIGLVIITVCLVLSDKFPRIAQVFAYTGQLALTAYVGHIALLRWVLTGWPYNFGPAEAIGLIILGFAAFVAFAALWRWKFSQGPLELILRKVGHLAAGR